MDPVLSGLLQQAQSQAQPPQMQSALPLQKGPQMVAPPQSAAIPPQTAPSNPFDVGIRTAIESARQSLAATREQKERAMQNSLLTFAEGIGKEPRQRGFFNNFASYGRAAIPAVKQYNQEAGTNETMNQQLANQILVHQAAQQAAQARAAEKEWAHGHAEAQLGEQKRAHNLLDNFRQLQGSSAEEREKKYDLGERRLELAERRLEEAKLKREAIMDLGGKKLGLSSIPQRTRTFSVNLDAVLKEMDYLERRLEGMDWSDTLQSYIPKSPTQAEMNSLAKTYKHTLARMEPFVAQGVLNTLPTIDPHGFPAANLKVIRSGRDLLLEQSKAINKERKFLKGLIEEDEEENLSPKEVDEMSSTMMKNSNDEYIQVPRDNEIAIRDAELDGFQVVE
jgi:hypothetical protein